MQVGIDSRAAIWYRGTGMGTYTYQLIRNIYLIEKKNQYHFFLPNEKFQGVDPLNSGVFQSIAQTKDKFWEAVAAENIDPQGMDIYHVPQNGIGLPKIKRCPTVVTVHDLIPYILPETVGPAYLKIFKQEMPRILSEADHVITVSQHSRNDLIKIMKLPPEKISVIYEAPESTYRKVNKEISKQRLQNKYGITDPYLLYLGGFSPRKNLNGLVKAYAQLKKELAKPPKLVIIGRHSPSFPPLAALVAKLGLEKDVLFPGFAPVQDLPFLYNAAELFIYPSFYEGFGLPPIEALACGTPTIVSNISSLPEVVGDAALKVDPHSQQAMTQAMYRLLTEEDLRRDLIKKGMRRSEEFSWTKTASQTIKIYQDMCGK